MDVNSSVVWCGDLQRSSGCCDVSFAQQATYMGHKMKKKGVKKEKVYYITVYIRFCDNFLFNP